MARVSTSARRNLDAPLAEDSTGSRFERWVVLPYLAIAAVSAFLAGVVILAVLFSLK